MQATALMPSMVEGLFATAPVWEIPTVAARYDYKKDPGDADVRHREDNIRT